VIGRSGITAELVDSIESLEWDGDIDTSDWLIWDVVGDTLIIAK
jgi:hypothetical protein